MRIRATLTRAVAATALIVPTLVWFAEPAGAGVSLTAQATFTDNVTVGDHDRAGSVTVVNPSPDNGATLASVTLVPSCSGAGAGGVCTPDTADPLAFTLSPFNAQGRSSSACPNAVFTHPVVDATQGLIRFTPNAPVALSPLAVCIIDFTYDVMQLPNHDANDVLGGTQTNQLAQAIEADATAGPVGVSTITVQDALPALRVSLPASDVPVGIGLGMRVTLTGVANVPTGVLTIKAFGPDEDGCSPERFSAVIPAANSGEFSSVISDPAAGTYRWTVLWSQGGGGDVELPSAFLGCGTPGLVAEVFRIAPTIEAHANNTSLDTDVPISANAKLTGGNPNGSFNGTLRFRRYSDAQCEDLQQENSYPPQIVAGQVYPSFPLSSGFTGDWYWIVDYSGDPYNLPVTTTCGELVSYVTPKAPHITGTATSPPNLVTDTVVIDGGPVEPSGKITFRMFGPTDSACLNPPVFEQTVTVLASQRTHTVTASPQPTAPGLYWWTVSYDWLPVTFPAGTVPPVETPCLTSGQLSEIKPPSERLPTEIKVTPTRLQLRPFRSTTGTVSATLTTSGVPLAGQPITFRAGGATGPIVCQAPTNAQGVAGCRSLTTTQARQVRAAGRVTASYPGNLAYLPVQGSAGEVG